MPKFIPTSIPSTAPDSEKRVWNAFKHLDEDWTVFHSVVWQSRRAGRQGDGETDFLLLHPKKGIIVLEVKGGRIEVDNGRWVTIDRHDRRHDIKNPFEQAIASKYALIRYIEDLALDCFVPVCHGVVFPNVSHNGQIGTYGPRPIIFDGNDLSSRQSSPRQPSRNCIAFLLQRFLFEGASSMRFEKALRKYWISQMSKYAQ